MDEALLKTKEEIAQWLEMNMIEDYTINDDLTVDVDNHIFLYMVPMEQLPVQFGIVNGDFLLGENGLTTLKGVPTEVKGDFTCGGNNGINTLEYFPEIVGFRIILTNNSIEDWVSPLREGNNIIWTSDHIAGLTYIDIDEHNYYKYDIDDYLIWNSNMREFYHNTDDEDLYVI